MTNSSIKTMENTISFSIIIPNKNRLTLLRRAVKSVLDQSYPNYEIIIVDDSSEDEFSTIVNEMEQNDKIRIIRGSGGGSAKARSIGYLKARYPFVAFLDSDDYWSKDKLLYHAKAYSLYPEIVVCFDIWVSKDSNNQEFIYPPLDYMPGKIVKIRMADVHKELLRFNFIHASAGSFKKCALNEDFPPKEPQDYFTWLRLSTKGSFGVIGYQMSVKDIQTDSRGRNKKVLFEERINILREKVLLIKNYNILSKHNRMRLLFFSITGFFINFFTLSDIVKKIMHLVSN